MSTDKESLNKLAREEMGEEIPAQKYYAIGTEPEQQPGSKGCSCGCDDLPLYCGIAHELNKIPNIDPFDDEKWIVDRIWKAITEHGIKAASNWNFDPDKAPNGEELLVATKSGHVCIALATAGDERYRRWRVPCRCATGNDSIGYDAIIAWARINAPVKDGQVTQEVQDYIAKAVAEDRPLEGMPR